MNSPSRNSSPKFKHLVSKHKQSPIEIKEKMRKNYKEKVKNCRDILLNRFRGSVENDLCSTLTEIYNSMFNMAEEAFTDVDEYQLIEELKNELIQEEYDWLLSEYEKANMEDIDWSLAEEDHNVICPVCQKVNLDFKHNAVNCSICKININNKQKSYSIKKHIMCCIENHSTGCNTEPQFTGITELNETHIYMLCDSCKEMKLII